MAKQNVIRCIVDDTILSRNISEIESWVSQGKICLVVPLYTIGRLHVLKKDSSQIGMNARKAVKFLDRSTSSHDDSAEDPVILQGPDEEYPTWTAVEAHYLHEDTDILDAQENNVSGPDATKSHEEAMLTSIKATNGAGGALSQLLLDKLNFATDRTATSPTSTPPLSPSSSGPQSSKTSPEVKSATLTATDKTPVPPSLKPLLNPVVWYVHERKAPVDPDLVFLTNSADTMHLARDFGIPTKNIHQLRSALGIEDTDAKSEASTSKEPIKKTPRSEPKTLFSYHDAESDDEEVVFKPRGRGSARATQSSRGAVSANGRVKGNHGRSPRVSFSTPTQQTQPKPQIPIEEIDPDSFDRGSFGRGSTPLANVNGNQPSNQVNNGRGSASGSRGNHTPGGARGTTYARGGYGRGIERGSASGRGRGRLFVP
ncbi:hypothetical protein, variant [Exophiala sideris]|uniref:PIN domain-containing protein n=1 Tax=Exophiala sideris TaxID=1016849 RepID=A0A0D1Y5X6_9EURO|nr:hypothetical protein PV11_10011 [Exophiala sideris]KIV78282.1 hypothetical protein, variant [Exophiala sideris]